MQYLSAIKVSRMVRLAAILLLSCLLFSSYAFGQQTYVGRWDAYGGYTDILQPSLNLAEPGFNGQFGFRPKTWLTLGFDYSVASGRNTLESRDADPIAGDATRPATGGARNSRSGTGRLQSGSADAHQDPDLSSRP